MTVCRPRMHGLMACSLPVYIYWEFYIGTKKIIFILMREHKSLWRNKSASLYTFGKTSVTVNLHLATNDMAIITDISSEWVSMWFSKIWPVKVDRKSQASTKIWTAILVLSTEQNLTAGTRKNRLFKRFLQYQFYAGLTSDAAKKITAH